MKTIKLTMEGKNKTLIDKIATKMETMFNEFQIYMMRSTNELVQVYNQINNSLTITLRDYHRYAMKLLIQQLNQIQGTTIQLKHNFTPKIDKMDFQDINIRTTHLK